MEIRRARKAQRGGRARASRRVEIARAADCRFRAAVGAAGRFRPQQRRATALPAILVLAPAQPPTLRHESGRQHLFALCQYVSCSSCVFERLTASSVPLGVAALGVQASLYDVPGGYRAVMFDRFAGVKPQATGEGTHFLLPWLQRAILYDVRVKPRTISTTTGSKDLQMITLSLRVLSRPDVQHLSSIYQGLGLDYDERVLPSIGNEVLKATVAQFDAAELITQREVVSARIREDLLRRAREFNIILEDVSITHLTFGREFTKAVEQKQIAQQDAERAKFVVEKAEQERQASVIRSEGEAEAATTISAALEKAGDGLLTIRRIDASKDIASTLSNSRNVTYLPHGNGMLYVFLMHCVWRRTDTAAQTQCSGAVSGPRGTPRHHTIDTAQFTCQRTTPGGARRCAARSHSRASADHPVRIRRAQQPGETWQ